MRALLLGLAVVLSSCASLKKDKNVCPEYRDLICVGGGTECSFNAERGCKVCQCTNPYPNPSGRQPDQRDPAPR